LAEADLPLKPAEAIFFAGSAAILAMLIGLFTFKLLGMALAGVLFLLLPVGAVKYLGRKRRNKFEDQLPDTLQLLAGTLRAGYSLAQGMEVLSKQTEEPMRSELTQMMSEAQLGRPIEEALRDIATRMRSKDFETVVTAIEIQREVGGNLAELLTTVKKTLVARKGLRGEIKALTAEGRISAVVLVSLPPLVGLMIEVVNPPYLAPMLTTLLGQVILVAAGISMGFGWVVMRRLMRVEI
jgi:tight adherence protein B